MGLRGGLLLLGVGRGCGRGLGGGGLGGGGGGRGVGCGGRTAAARGASGVVGVEMRGEGLRWFLCRFSWLVLQCRCGW